MKKPKRKAAPRISNTLSATIPAGKSLSSAIQVNYPVVSLLIPDEWDVSGGITFQASPDGVTYRDLFDGSGEIVLQEEAGVQVWLGTERYALQNTYVKIRSGTRKNPVPQSADRTLQILVDTQALK